VPNTEVAESIFDGITYSKGAAVLSQLMFVMGDQNFSAANAAFFKKYAWKNASFDDLINIMQQHFSNEHFTLAQWK
jgi:aminopeptidase N